MAPWITLNLRWTVLFSALSILFTPQVSATAESCASFLQSTERPAACGGTCSIHATVNFLNGISRQEISRELILLNQLLVHLNFFRFSDMDVRNPDLRRLRVGASLLQNVGQSPADILNLEARTGVLLRSSLGRAAVEFANSFNKPFSEAGILDLRREIVRELETASRLCTQDHKSCTTQLSQLVALDKKLRVFLEPLSAPAKEFWRQNFAPLNFLIGLSEAPETPAHIQFNGKMVSLAHGVDQVQQQWRNDAPAVVGFLLPKQEVDHAVVLCGTQRTLMLNPTCIIFDNDKSYPIEFLKIRDRITQTITLEN